MSEQNKHCSGATVTALRIFSSISSCSDFCRIVGRTATNRLSRQRTPACLPARQPVLQGTSRAVSATNLGFRHGFRDDDHAAGRASGSSDAITTRSIEMLARRVVLLVRVLRSETLAVEPRSQHRHHHHHDDQHRDD